MTAPQGFVLQGLPVSQPLPFPIFGYDEPQEGLAWWEVALPGVLYQSCRSRDTIQVVSGSRFRSI